MGEITRRLFRHFTFQQSGTASPPQHPRIPQHPVRTFTPTTTPNSGVARRGRAREGETAFANSECFPFSQTCPRQSVPSKGKKPTHSSSQQRKKCQLIRMPQHPYPTGRSSTVRKLRKEEPDHFLLQEVRSPVTLHYPSRASAP